MFMYLFYITDYFKSTVELYPMVVANHNSNAMCYRTGQELKNDSI